MKRNASMDTRAGLVSGSIALISRATSQLCMLGVTVVATRTLSIGDFGAFALASAAMVLSRNLFYVGPYEYLLKTPEAPGLRANCLAANLWLGLLSMAAALVFASFSTALFGTALVGSLLVWLAPSILAAACTAWFEALLLRDQRLRSYYAVTMTGELAGSGLAIALLWGGFGPYALIAQIYGRIATILTIYLLFRHAGSIGRPDWRGTGAVLAWSRLRYTSTFLNFGSNYGADFILGAVLSPAASGLYRASSRIVTAVADLFAQPLLKIAQTNVSARFAQGQAADRTWLTMFAGVALFAWAALAFMAAFAGDIIDVMLGEKWHAAAPIVILFCSVRAITLMDSCTIPLLVCSDRKRMILSTQTAAAVFTMLGSMALAPLGPAAVAAGVGAVLVAVSLAYAVMAARLSRVSASDMTGAAAMSLLPAGLAIGCGAAAHAGLSGATMWILVGTSAAALAGFAAGLYLMRGMAALSLAALGGSGAALPAE